MPRHGAVGAATAFLLAYATQAGVAFFFARRLYRIPYESGRLLRVAVAGVLAAAAGHFLPAWSPVPSLILRATVTTTAFVGLLWIGGFLRPTERGFLRDTVARLVRT